MSGDAWKEGGIDATGKHEFCSCTCSSIAFVAYDMIDILVLLSFLEFIEVFLQFLIY